MSFVCEICAKRAGSGNQVSHSNRKARRTFKPNLQVAHIKGPTGSTKRVRACTACLSKVKQSAA